MTIFKKTGISLFFAIVAVLLFSTHSSAQSITWTGNAGTSDWHTPGNWQNNQLPTAGSTVNISPQGNNPYPVVTEDATISTINISSNYSGGELTVRNAKLTITNKLNISGSGKLFIKSGGSIFHTGSNFTMAYNNSDFKIDNGSFTSDAYVKIRGNGLDAEENVDLNFNNGLELVYGKSLDIQSGNLDVNGNFTSSGKVDINSADSVSITGNVTIDNTFNLEKGTFTIGGFLKSGSSAPITIGTSNIMIGTYVDLSNSFTLNDGSLDVDSYFKSSGIVNFGTANVNIAGYTTMDGEFIMDSDPSSSELETLYIGGGFSAKAIVNIGSIDMTVEGNMLLKENVPKFSIASGSIDVKGGFKLSGNEFAAGSATIDIALADTINGTYNGEDGTTTFSGQTTVNSGGRVNLNSGTINFDDGAYIGNNAKTNFGSGTVNLQGDIRVKSSGTVNVHNAIMNVSGNGNFSNSGHLNVQHGEINFSGNVHASSSGNINLNDGNFSVGGNIDFSNSGHVTADSAKINIGGDFTFNNQGSSFKAGNSTVTFNGGDTQTINTGGEDVTFHNVIVTSGTTLQTDGSGENTVIIENDLTVESNASVNVRDYDTIDIQGDLDNNGTVESKHPFIYAIRTPSATEVVVIYDQPMGSTAGDKYNYSIDNGISVNKAELSDSDPTKVTLDISPDLSTEVDYYTLTLSNQNIKSADGEPISNNHLKRFHYAPTDVLYSCASGDWDEPSSWCLISHEGPKAKFVPNGEDGISAQIGNDHTITIESEEDISNMKELLVKSSGSLQIGSSGTLTLNEFIIKGEGTFTLNPEGTLEIGSVDGITSETAAGNIQTASRTFSNRGNYIYSGDATQHTGNGLPPQVNNLFIRNGSNVEASSNIKTTGTLYLENGSLIIPSGQSIIANEKEYNENGNLIFRRILSGSPGWRMISSPVKTDYSDFLSGILTQGYKGSELGENDTNGNPLQPNILYYDETYSGTDNQRWRAPESAGTSVEGGRGFNAYIFGNVSEDNRYNDPLPDTLAVEGQEFEGSGSGDFDFGVTYTEDGDNGWNLIGNPFGATIDWDEAASWTKNNIDQTVYVWSPEDKEYKTSNTQDGSLDDGKIAPFQAFWIKANAANPQLQVNEEAKTVGGTFVGKTRNKSFPKIEIALLHNDLENTIFFTFSEGALVGKDPYDAYLLQPPPGISDYMQFFSIAEKKKRFVINALPRKFGVPIEIPLSANIYQDGYKVEENANMTIKKIENVPSSWSISIIDRKSGKVVASTEGASSRFKTKGEVLYKQQSHTKEKGAVSQRYKIIADADKDEARFMLKIDPGNDAADIPSEVALNQNYPNPATGITTISFDLPIQSEVNLKVYDILGRPVDTIIDSQTYEAGYHDDVEWDTSGLSSGTYIYVLQTSDTVISKKLTIIK